MHLVALFSPFFGFFFSALFGRYIGTSSVMFLTVFSVFISFYISCSMLQDMVEGSTVSLYLLFNWFDSGVFNLSWSFLFDQLTTIMFFVVTFVSLLVHLYSIEYMRGDPHHARFMAYLSLFTFFMLFLVSSANFLQIFIGWEGVGLASYLLINFWFTRSQANKSALKAIVVNRVGDFFLGIAMVLIVYLYRSLDFSTVFSVAYHYNSFFINFLGIHFNMFDLITLFLFLGAVGKSAQLGLHTWLPDAMEGPTPVSALIHAATMVTAGVFVLIRSSPLFEHSASVLYLVCLIGSFTALFGATVAVFQNDMKKIVAYSTCSQLGYMVFCCGLSAYNVAFFHLFNHAFFKALLFLSAGSIIHALADEQDLRRMGSMSFFSPVTYAMFFIGSFSLMGFPFLTGFYSKDLILELSFSGFSSFSLLSYTLGVVSAFFTAFYSFKLIYFSFLAKPSGFKSSFQFAHEPSFFMMFPLLALCVASIWLGYIFRDLFVGMGSDFFGASIYVGFSSLKVTESEYIPFYVKLIPLVFTLCGIGVSYFFVCYYNYFSYSVYGLEKFLSKRWFFDVVYNSFLVRYLLSFSRSMGFNMLDRGVVELLGPSGFISLVRVTWTFLSLNFQTGYVFHYLQLLVTGLLSLVVGFTFLSAFSASLDLVLLGVFFTYFALA